MKMYNVYFFVVKVTGFLAPIQDLFHLNLCELAITLARKCSFVLQMPNFNIRWLCLEKVGVTCKYKANIVNYCQQLQ